MLLQDAAFYLKFGVPIRKPHRNGGYILVKSVRQFMQRCGELDCLSNDWEPYPRTPIERINIVRADNFLLLMEK